MTILIVDDSSFMRQSMKKILYRNGFTETREASNGLEAFDCMRSESFGLVLLDISMDVMDGLSVLRHLKAEGKKQPIVVISAEGNDHVIQEAMMLGALDFIIKPFKEQRIVEVVNRCQGGL